MKVVSVCQLQNGACASMDCPSVYSCDIQGRFTCIGQLQLELSSATYPPIHSFTHQYVWLTTVYCTIFPPYSRQTFQLNYSFIFLYKASSLGPLVWTQFRLRGPAEDSQKIRWDQVQTFLINYYTWVQVPSPAFSLKIGPGSKDKDNECEWVLVAIPEVHMMIMLSMIILLSWILSSFFAKFD